MSLGDTTLQARLDAFEMGWRAGPPTDLLAFFRASAKECPALREREAAWRFLFQLLQIDLERHWRRWAESDEEIVRPNVLEDYVGVIPFLASVEKIPFGLVVSEFRARRRAGDDTPAEAYGERFPHLRRHIAESLGDEAQKMANAGYSLPRIPGMKLFLPELGEGSYGCVYKGRTVAEDRLVAVKVFKRTVIAAAEEGALAGIQREAVAVAKIDSPHVVTLYRAELNATPPYIVMQYAAGGSLRARLKSGRYVRPNDVAPVNWQREVVAPLVRDVALGVAAAHAKNVVHRDLKPENILFDAEGRPKLSDFGAARLLDQKMSSRGAKAGTDAYKAPEQHQLKREADARTDVYALGLLLYELLTGTRPPESGVSIRSELSKPPSPREVRREVSPDLDKICRKCLEYSPALRYQTAVELIQDLTRFSAGAKVENTSASPMDRGWRAALNHPVVSGSIFGFVVTVLISIAIVGVKEWQVRQAKGDVKKKDIIIHDQGEELANQQKVVEESTLAAAASREKKRRLDYAVDMAEIQKAWNAGDQKTVKTLLARYESAQEGVENDLRGFEWYYWRHLLGNLSPTFEAGDRCRCLAVDPQGKYLAATGFQMLSGQVSQNLYLWNLGDGSRKEQWTIIGSRSNTVTGDFGYTVDGSVAFSPDGRLVAATAFVISREGRKSAVKVWDVETRKELLSIVGDPEISGRAVAFSPDSSLVLAGGYGNRTRWKSWNVKTKNPGPEAKSNVRTPNGSLPAILSNGWEIVTSLRFAEDGHRLFAAKGFAPPSGRPVAMSWKWPSGEPEEEGIYEWGGALPSGLVSSPRSGFPWIANLNLSSREVRLFESVRTRPVNAPLGDGPLRHFREVAFSSSVLGECVDLRGNRLAVGALDHHVYVWSLHGEPTRLSEPQVYRGHASGITSVAIMPDGHPVSADELGIIRLWSESKPEAVRLRPFKHCLTIRANEGESPALVVELDGEPEGRIPIESGSRIEAAVASRSGRFIAVRVRRPSGDSRPDNFVVWDLKENRAVVTSSYGSNLSKSRMAFSDDERRVASLSETDEVAVWSTQTGERLGRISAAQIQWLQLSETGNYLGVRLLDSFMVWDVDSGKIVAKEPASGDLGKGPEFVFTANERSVVIAGTPVVIWDIPSGQRRNAEPAELDTIIAESLGDHGRVYDQSEGNVVIHCAKTLRPLLRLELLSPLGESMPFRQSGDALELLDMQPVPGAVGLIASDALDRRFADILRDWGELSD